MEIPNTRPRKRNPKIPENPIQLKSIEHNDLYLRRMSRNGKKRKFDVQLTETDISTIPDEYSPAERIQTPPNFLKWLNTHRKAIC